MVETPTAQASPRKASGACGGDFVEVVIPELLIYRINSAGFWPMYSVWLPQLNLAQSQLRDRRQLHERGPFVDLSDLGVAIQFLNGIVLHEAGPTVDFNGETGHTLGHVRGEVFAHGGLFQEVELCILQAGGVVDKQTRRFDI